MRERFQFRILVMALAMSTPALARAADEARVNAAIQKAQGYLAAQLSEAGKPEKSLAAYALIKSGADKKRGDIQAAVQSAVQEATTNFMPGKPRYGHGFAYTVPCHMFLLEADDPVAHKELLAGMAGYLIEHQQGNGSWFYDMVPSPEACDTSQTQFALLGLWTAARAGVDVPQEPVERAAKWLLQTQHEDGGFAYQPWSGSKPHEKETFLLTTLSGAGAVLIARQILFPGVKFGEEVSQMTKAKKKYGVLERLQDDQEKARAAGEVSIPLASIDRSVSRSLNFVDSHFTVTSAEPHKFLTYQFYAMERMSALLDSDLLGKHDWYAIVSDELVRLQLTDGSWGDKIPPLPATSLGILCLSRATAQILGHPAKKLGGGLLAGARGLPNDLSELGKKQNLERKSKGEVDDLLALLEKTDNVSVAEVQQAILESVNLDDRDQLVGEVDRLRRLAVDPRAEVRRTALWAIGRSGDIKLAPLLIAAFKDVDVGVIREASFGLTVLSRKPTGIEFAKGKLLPVDPLDGLEEDATDEARQAHLDRWLAQAEAAWKKWYLSVRPYDERDDRQSLQRRK